MLPNVARSWDNFYKLVTTKSCYLWALWTKIYTKIICSRGVLPTVIWVLRAHRRDDTTVKERLAAYRLSGSPVFYNMPSVFDELYIHEMTKYITPTLSRNNVLHTVADRVMWEFYKFYKAINTYWYFLTQNSYPVSEISASLCIKYRLLEICCYCL